LKTAAHHFTQEELRMDANPNPLEDEIAFGNQLCIGLAEHLVRLQAGGIHRIVARENSIIEIIVTVKARV
jgi:hypothetical protein